MPRWIFVLLFTALAWAQPSLKILSTTAVSSKAKLADGRYNSSPYIVLEVMVQNDGSAASTPQNVKVRLVPKGRKASKEGNTMNDPFEATLNVPVLQARARTCLTLETPYRSADEFRSSMKQFSCCNIDPSGSKVLVEISTSLEGPPTQ